jgi:peptide/nickel transport system ATP-binding protein
MTTNTNPGQNQPEIHEQAQTRPGSEEYLLEVKNLKTHFPLKEGVVRAVDGVDFAIKRGESLGVVGESGSGKSITARSVLRIVAPPGQIVDGDILFHRPARDGNPAETLNLAQLDPRGDLIRSIRGGDISMVFQEPMTSLSPVHTIGNQIMTTLRLHQGMDKPTARQSAISTLEHVGMPKPDQTIDNYPHQLSGGMRQRAMIAMALSCQPSLLIADEPTTALDVTTEAQILDMMRNLQDELGMAIMFITHNLGVVAEMTQKVIVMYLGKVVETADVDSIFYNPKHPYTQSLLRSIPRLGRKSGNRLESIKGMVPDPFSIPQGCPFHPRCPEFIKGVCDQIVPKTVEVETGHSVNCHLYE